MIADAVLVFIGYAGERMLHHRFPGNFAECFVEVGGQEFRVPIELDRRCNELRRFAIERGIEDIALQAVEAGT